VVTQAIDFLRRRDPRKPFFLWMSFVRPHSPLDPPQVYWDQYIGHIIPPAPVGDWADKSTDAAPPIDASASRGRLEARAFHRARAAYYALITHIDHQIGRFMQMLHEHELLDNTLILFTSDHGDLLGDHNLLRKAYPYEGAAHVPFILHTPRVFDMGLARGSVAEEVVELRDVMPTFLEAAGADVPQSVEGESVLALARGEKVAWREYLHGEHTLSLESVQFLTDGREKYLWFSGEGREQLFDLVRDPTELVDLAADPANSARVGRWREILAKELAGREEGFSAGGRLVTGRSVKPVLGRRLRRPPYGGENGENRE
jgi:arylsulfatase A-like enzyme